MRSFAVALLVSAGVLSASGAFAGPMTNSSYGLSNDTSIQQVRLVCDESGRCFRTRGPRRVMNERDSYNYERRGRYQERRYEQSPGIGVQVPGVSIGIGGGNRW